MERRIGAHVSIGKGYSGALERTQEIGGNCMQIFSTSPRGWRHAEIGEKEAKEFVRMGRGLNIEPVYFHATYLINLADRSSIGHLSKRALVGELNLAPQLELKGSIIHLGSFKEKIDEGILFGHEKYEALITNIKEVLKETPKETLFIVENAGVRKIGRSIEEIERIVKDVGDERVRVCLDTCHLHATGYDISSREKLDKFLAEFDKKIGLAKLEIWHLNDSRDSFESFRDRHENIGKGEIGLDVFRLLLNHPHLSKLPFIIETPGFEKEGPDKKNIDILKGLVEG